MAVINISINKKKISKEVADNTILSDFLRDKLALTGTHVGCDTSQCGACVVHLNGNSVKSCTVLVADCNGSEITTIEGLAKNGEMHPMQEAFKKNHAIPVCSTICCTDDFFDRFKSTNFYFYLNFSLLIINYITNNYIGVF